MLAGRNPARPRVRPCSVWDANHIPIGRRSYCAIHLSLRATGRHDGDFLSTTAAALAALHLKVDLIPEEYVAESVLQAFEKIPIEGARILLPRAAGARDLIPAELEKRGARVQVVEAYRTVPARDVPWPADLHPDWVLFTSSSTVENFVALLGPERLQGASIGSIGPITSATARRLDLEVTVEASPHTIQGLIDALCACTEQRP